MTTKQCYKCKTIKPLAEFYKHGSTKDGLRGDCKTCGLAASKAYQAAAAVTAAQRREAVQTKLCKTCNITKPPSAFRESNFTKDGFRGTCRACEGIRSRDYYSSRKRDELMRYYKFNSIYKGLNAIQKRVYEAIPISEAWDSTKIKAEIFRTGSQIENKILMGCINRLVSAGLVKERERNTFQREPVDSKDQPLINDELEETEDAPPAPIQQTLEVAMPEKATDPIDSISRLTEKAETITIMMRGLISDIETVALEVQESFASQGKEAEKLKQLQQLLKSLD